MARKTAETVRCALCGAKDVSEPRGDERYCRELLGQENRGRGHRRARVHAQALHPRAERREVPRLSLDAEAAGRPAAGDRRRLRSVPDAPALPDVRLGRRGLPSRERSRAPHVCRDPGRRHRRRRDRAVGRRQVAPRSVSRRRRPSPRTGTGRCSTKFDRTARMGPVVSKKKTGLSALRRHPVSTVWCFFRRGQRSLLMSTRKSSAFYGVLIALASLVVGMVIASHLGLTPASVARPLDVPAANSAPLSGPVDATTFRNIARDASPSVVSIRTRAKREVRGMARNCSSSAPVSADSGRQPRGTPPADPRGRRQRLHHRQDRLRADQQPRRRRRDRDRSPARRTCAAGEPGLKAKLVGRDVLTDTALLQITDMPDRRARARPSSATRRRSRLATG